MVMRNLCFALVVLCLSVSCSTGRKDLARAIRSDRSLYVVDSMGRELLSRGFNAGGGYSQVWIRDLNTFISTSCEVVPQEQVRTALLLFFAMQQDNGEMVDGYVLRDEFTWYDPQPYWSELAPGHVGFKNTVETDQETSLIQAVGKYIASTGDTAILREPVGDRTVYERMKLMLDYLMREKYDSSYGLIIGALTADWGDVQAYDYTGHPVDINEHTIITIDMYDNAMLVTALDWMLRYCDDADRDMLAGMRESFASNARRWLWDGRRGKVLPHLYPGGKPERIDFDEDAIYCLGSTVAAAEAGLLSRRELAANLDKMVDNYQNAGMPSIGLTLYPPYPEGFFPGGMSNQYVYQNGGDWTWFGGRMIQQLVRYGLVREAYEQVLPMVERVISKGGFYEWYGKGNVPGGSSEFKGAAGVLCESVRMLDAWAGEYVK